MSAAKKQAKKTAKKRAAPVRPTFKKPNRRHQRAATASSLLNMVAAALSGHEKQVLHFAKELRGHSRHLASAMRVGITVRP